jgi:hypothetical protein
MYTPGERITAAGTEPGDSLLAEWLGTESYERWKAVTTFIEQNYPGIFSPNWIYGGKKHGWRFHPERPETYTLRETQGEDGRFLNS